MTDSDTAARRHSDSGCRTVGLDATTLAARVGELGEYFGLTAAAGPTWQPMSSLLDDGAAVQDQVARTRHAIAAAANTDVAAIPVKVAASALQLSIASRLLSPAIGAATCFTAVPLLTSRCLFWRRGPGHTPELAVADVDWVEVATPRDAANLIAESLVDDVLRRLNFALRTVAALSPQVTWGNVASAANGAVTVLSQSRPPDAGRGRALVVALIDAGPLLGAAELSGGRFRRHSCCLYYLVPGSGYCGDCVLTGSSPAT
jgi:hypothetical protein